MAIACPDIYVATSTHGFGVFASRKFSLGEEILDIDGVVVPDPADGSDDESLLIQVDLERYVYPSSPARYLNHSCDPNAALTPAMALIARRLIAEGEEIRFDYSTCILDDPWTLACRCGSASCRGTVGDFRLLPVDIQASYLQDDHVLAFVSRFLHNGPEDVTEREHPLSRRRTRRRMER